VFPLSGTILPPREVEELPRTIVAIVCVLVAALATPAAAELPDEIYPQGMVAYWTFDDGAGTTLSDIVGDHDGQIAGASWSEGMVGGSLDFDGLDDSVSFGTSAFLNTSSAFSYSVRLRLDDLGEGTCEGDDFAAYDQMIVATHEGPYLYLATTGRLVAMVETVAGWRLVAADTCSWTEGVWHHVAVTLDGTAMRMYVDGSIVDEVAGGAKLTSGDGYFVKLGQMHYLDQYYLDGAIDELAVYNRALTADEVDRHYQNGLLGVEFVSELLWRPPVISAPWLNRLKPGASVPIRFTLQRDFGLDIVADGYPVSRQIRCETAEPLSGTSPARGSQLTYNPRKEIYTYVWRTDRTWLNTCREWIIGLDQGTIHELYFDFRR
jgi:hypothetical protein